MNSEIFIKMPHETTGGSTVIAHGYDCREFDIREKGFLDGSEDVRMAVSTTDRDDAGFCGECSGFFHGKLLNDFAKYCMGCFFARDCDRRDIVYFKNRRVVAVFEAVPEIDDLAFLEGKGLNDMFESVFFVGKRDVY